ncbi:MAG: fatty acid kinase [Thermoleophilaceae bacterium]|nr:fatty acid kinase [Thermoleophilaceae bacterium]
MPDPSIVRFRRAVATACAELDRRRQEVNDLNVFPVADGDTGDNMAMTMRAVLAELDRINGQMVDDIGRDELVAAVARAALLGARGNSGVILSQIVRGAAQELASRPGELIDPILVSAAFARAADAAYESVRNPAEGTMLSAIRAMAHRIAQDLAHMSPQRLDPGVAPEQQDELLAEVLERALDAGEEAVKRGPEQLEVLREAGVVDAGAYGLTVIIAGVIAALRGDERRPELEHHHAPAGRDLHLPQHGDSRYRYCTNFAVTGVELDGPSFVPRLEEIGDSVLVVGDSRTLKVHVHTDEPDRAVALFESTPGASEVSRLDVADMREQVAERAARLGTNGNGNGHAPAADAIGVCGAVVVASGEGLVEMYRALGAHVVDGGRTLNPSTYDILAAIHAVPAAEAIVLPNSPNVILAAERAAELSEKPACVVPTRAQQVGLAALLAFDSSLTAGENATAVGAAAGSVVTGGVARAARDDASGRFHEGDAVGYASDELIAWGEPAETLAAVLKRVCDGCEVVTVVAGEDAPLDADAVADELPDGLELDHHDGGQPSWWWLIAAE